jgi:nitrogen regulatory protein A
MIYQYKEEIQYELDQLRSVTSSDFSGLAWIEHHDSRIRWLYASGNSNERYKKLALKPGRGLAGLVIKLGRNVIVDAAMQNLERLRQDYSIMLVEQLLSVIAVPITIRFETCGVLLIGERTERFYEKNDLYLITNLADRIALLLQQIKYNELKK